MDKLWYVIHFTCLRPCDRVLKDSIRREIITMLKVFYVAIPCDTCSNHYLEYLQEHPVEDYFEHASQKLFNWSVDLHNSVNRKIGKPEMSYEDAFLFWSTIRTHNHASNMGSNVLGRPSYGGPRTPP